MGLIIDLFAGGGGASEGIRMALGRDPDVAVNHDPIAVAMHARNHPGTKHFCQDVFSVPPQWVTKGQPVDLLWASPDCTHFSKAKGAAPTRDLKRRDLAWVVVKWAREVRPAVICLENVEEFTTWGPLDSKGRIIDCQKGATFRSFVGSLRRLGYSVQWRELRACDFGAPTIRKRLFLVARCDGQPIVWPEPTHGPGRAQPYRTAAECIDWSLPCPSIFDRKRPLAEATLRRIAKDVLRCIREHGIPIPEVYGAIVEGADGQLVTTGVRRTGCAFCAFGLHLDHLDGGENRFQRLARTHPRLYAYCMDRLGLREVLRYCRDHAPANLARRFVWSPSTRMERGTLLGAANRPAARVRPVTPMEAAL